MNSNQPNLFATRRDELMRRLGPRSAAFIYGGNLVQRNSDVDHRFRQSSDLLFLTGFAEPEAVCVLRPGAEKPFTMFVRPRDPERETWTGRRLGVEGAVNELGASQAYPIEDLDKQLENLLDGCDEVHYAIGQDLAVDQRIVRTVAQLRDSERRGRCAPKRLVDLRLTLHEMRLRKDAASLEALRTAVSITGDAYHNVTSALKPGMYEYEIEALLDYHFRRRGSAGPGYGTIVGGGENATILHYVENSAVLRVGDLVLIDAGAEFGGLTADVTRTYPVGGKFSPAQRQVYDLVLGAEKLAIALSRPGTTIDAIHGRVIEHLTRGLVELGILAGEVKNLIEAKAYSKFFMHRTSHWLGMDVHDVGAYYDAAGSRTLEPGMVFSVEPGLYLAAHDKDIPEQFRGIGVRIEDDILVTPEGCENLTHMIPKEPAELEEIIGKSK